MNTCLPPSEAACSMSWDYASFLWNLYNLGWRNQDAGPKCCHYSQTSCAQSPFNPFPHGAGYCWLWLHHHPVVSILLLLPSNSFLLPLHLYPLLPSSHAWGNYNIISGYLKNLNCHRVFDPSKNMYKNIFSNLY